MKKVEKTISAGHSCFLVKDASLLNGWESPVYRWLWDHGFASWGRKGITQGVDWVYVNLYSKVFAPGLCGYPVTSVVCDHAITFDEFEIIYNIYQQYEGLGALKMTKAEQEKHDEKLNQASGDGRRNAPCPCGSGLKYKHCCGKLH